jgi:hypothetical protein
MRWIGDNSDLVAVLLLVLLFATQRVAANHEYFGDVMKLDHVAVYLDCSDMGQGE